MGAKTDQAKGRIKQAAGDLTDDDELKNEGKKDEVEGEAKEKIDEAKDRVSDAVDDLRDKF